MPDSIQKKFTDKVRLLPPYCMNFFIAKNDVYKPKTKLSYAMDLYVFFYFLIDTYPDRFQYSKIEDVPLEVLNELTPDDISQYLFYLGDYAMKNEDGSVSQYSNSPAGKKRKLATLKSFFRYLNVNRKINNDPTTYIDTPKIDKKPILALSDKEESKIKKIVESGTGKTERALVFHEHTKYRDFALLTTFIHTGLRVSELVGLNMYDVDFDEQRLLVLRKGGKQDFVYFNQDVLMAIADYIDLERKLLMEGKADYEGDGPLFVSNRGTRITVDRVEKIIASAAKQVLPPNTKVSCHTLRKTFGSNLYDKTHDLLLVQHALGHESSETSSRYYIKFDESKLKILKGKE